MTRRKPLDVQLIDQRLMPRGTEERIVSPAEGRIDDDALRETDDAVALIPRQVGVWVPHRVTKQGITPTDRPSNRLGVRIQQELGGVETVAGRGLVWSM